MANAGKRIRAARESVDRDKQYDLSDAVKAVKAGAKAKFDETVDIAMNLGVDPKHRRSNGSGCMQSAKWFRAFRSRRCICARPKS